MCQKEVVQRICAELGHEAYGRLAVLSKWLADTTSEFDVWADVFVPPPKVTATIVTLVPR